MPTLAPIVAVVLDIEGTTTPISFVHDILFPYAASHVESYLRAHWDEASLRDHVDAIWAQSKKDAEAGVEGNVLVPPRDDPACLQRVLDNVQWQMKHDRKTTGLKGLQGLLWKDAYISGEIKGAVFDDVPKALEVWKTRGVRMFIYSSGSVAAQKLLFGYSVHGDLLPYFENHFDTTIGGKVDASSYSSIAQQIGVESPTAILFVTDNVKEASAARIAGFQVAVMDRPGNAAISDQDRLDYLVVTTFTPLVDAFTSVHVS